ncbi:prepilin peptidase [Caulobacter segnis]
MTPAPIVVTAAAVGAVVASYATTAAMREASELAPSGPRSRCDGCGRQLTWRESVPLVSFACLSRDGVAPVGRPSRRSIRSERGWGSSSEPP